MYHTTMKHILLSITGLLLLISFSYSPISAQDENINTEESIETEINIDEEVVETEEDIQEEDSSDEQTFEEVLDTNPESEDPTFTFFQIFVAVSAPLTFLLLAYLLIKKLKL